MAAGVLRHHPAEHHVRDLHVEPLPQQAHPHLLQDPRPLLLPILHTRPLYMREELPAGGAVVHGVVAPVLAAVGRRGGFLPPEQEVRH